MPNRRYLEDWEKPELTEEELFIEESLYSCMPHLGVSEDLIDRTNETDLIIEDVIPAPENPFSLFDVVVFSDVHSCTPVGDAQQSTGARMVDIVQCDEPECGGTGGWLMWFTNDPDATPESPENPLLPYH